jgi:transposase-like protein
MIKHAEEVTGNVAMTCRYYGISRTAYYRWLRRYEEHGAGGRTYRSNSAGVRRVQDGDVG